MDHTQFSKHAQKPELKSLDSATTRDFQSPVTAACVSSKLKARQNLYD